MNRCKLWTLLAALTATGLAINLTSLSSRAQEEKKEKEEKKEEEKKLEFPKTATRVKYLDLPVALRTALRKDIAGQLVFEKAKDAEGADVYVVAYNRYGQIFKVLYDKEGVELRKDDLTPPPPEVKADPKMAADPKMKADPTIKAVAKVDLAKVSFSKQVLPLLKGACGNCHDVAKRKADLDLTSSHGTVMDAVKAGAPGGSLLYLALTGNGAKRMPPNGKLPQEQIDMVKAWIAAGAKEN